MTKYKVVLFRGFEVVTPQDFEDTIIQVEPHLNNEYHGTSPRHHVTKYVFTASELPNFFPIPQHLEMSFLTSRPRRLFFFCQTEPETGGETPVTDFGAVWSDLDEDVRKKFAEKGVRYVRNYCGPNESSWDPSQLKPWPEVFQTTDRDVVEKDSIKDNLKLEWKTGDGIRLTNNMPSMLQHPITGETIWANHSQVFHPGTPHQEYFRIAQHQGRWRFYFWFLVGLILFCLKKLFSKEQDFPLNTLYGDGSIISLSDMNKVRNAIWKNTVFSPWRKGDVVLIDNLGASHGRMPYTGKQRSVLVGWG
jgi:alpha-ketoglutarate-dependent taurine dioxygenase